MYFGVDYHPEHWVFPYGGTAEKPEAQWVQDAQLMAAAGFNIVRIGEFSWGLCEREDGKFDFDWLKRVMDVFGHHEILVVLCTPTAAPPIWLCQKHPEILPVDEHGLVRHEGTRHAVSRTICNYQVKDIFMLKRPIKITTHNVFWFVKNKIIMEQLVHIFPGRQYGCLNALGVINTVGNFFFLLKNFVILNF